MCDWTNKTIPAAFENRLPPPRETWNFSDYSSWRSSLWDLVADFADADVRQEFVSNPPEFVVSDNLDWLDRVVASVQSKEMDSKASLAVRLRQNFRAIRAVHGTRTADLGSYYSQGLVPLDPVRAHRQAAEIFLSGAFPELDEARLQESIALVGSDLREKRTYFESNEQMLLHQAGHYMLYGSEYLIAIAAHLRGTRDYRQILKSRGTPTIFVCDVPMELIHEDTLQQFAGMALAALFQELLDGSDYQHDPWRGGAFFIDQQLPASCLVGHYHPQVLNDPFANDTLR